MTQTVRALFYVTLGLAGLYLLAGCGATQPPTPVLIEHERAIQANRNDINEIVKWIKLVQENAQKANEAQGE